MLFLFKINILFSLVKRNKFNNPRNRDTSNSFNPIPLLTVFDTSFVFGSLPPLHHLANNNVCSGIFKH